MAPNMHSLVSSLALLSTALALPSERRDATAAAVAAQTYDYVIIGGGLTGLVVANRLSEQSGRTVLVIENGPVDKSLRTLVPQSATTTNNERMYNITSAPEPNLGNATFQVLVGNVVGGGSVVNGMAADRASAADYDAWEKLGNDGWGWKGLLPYFRKSTTFTPPTQELIKQFNYTYDTTPYGKNGPLQIGYSHFDYPDANTIWKSFRAEGVPTPKEHAAGKAVGAFFSPMAIDPVKQTRSHAGNAYYDPVASRKNLKLITGQRVNEILFTGKTATGVQFVSAADNSVNKVYARREVILAAGAVFTPQILQLSGLGPKAVLQAAGVKVKKDFPAVGANLQDHPNTYVFYALSNQSFPNPNSLAENATYNATSWEEYQTKKTGPYTISHGNSLAFLSLPQITSTYKTLVQKLKAQKTTDFLPAAYKANKALAAGFEAQKAIIAKLHAGNDAAVGEFPMAPSGFSLAALQRPLSRGTITLDPKNKYGNPVVQWNTLQNPVDRDILLAMIRWNRQHWARKELAAFSPVELAPGPTAQADDEIIAALNVAGGITPTFGHASGTAAMLPENLGGVVSDELLVYGFDNLSVVDASIMPLIPATHLQATCYAIAEKAADLIKARNK